MAVGGGGCAAGVAVGSVVFIEPAACKSEQPLTVVRAVKLLAQHPNERAPVMASEPQPRTKTYRLHNVPIWRVML